MVESLIRLYYNGGRDREFAVAFAGSYEPARSPHRRDWKIADDHWVDFNGKVLESESIRRDTRRADATAQAKEIAIGLLWTAAFLRGLCPRCPTSLPGSHN